MNLIKLVYKLAIIIILLFFLFSCSYKYEFNLDKLFIELDYEYIKECLLAEGYSLNDFFYDNNRIYTNKIMIIRLINRIMSFKFIEERYIGKTFIDLEINNNEGETVIIITTNPFAIKEDITWNERNIIVPDINKYKKWKVDKKLLILYKNLNREIIIKEYFNEYNNLKKEYKKLLNPSFIYILIKNGFFVFISDITGRLTLYYSEKSSK